MAKPVDEKGNTWDLYIDRSKTYKYPYVKAKRSGWDPEKHQARILERQHGGRLFADGSVKLGKAFLARFPQFADGSFYYFENQLYTREEYLAKTGGLSPAESLPLSLPFPQGGDPEPVILDEEPEKSQVVRVGVSWVAWETLRQAGIIEELQATFGRERGKALAQLAVFAFENGAAWSLFGCWAEQTGLPGVPPLSQRAVWRMIEDVDPEQLWTYWRGRVARAKRLARDRRPESPEAGLLPLAAAFECVSGVPVRGDEDLEETGPARFAAVCDVATGEVLCAGGLCDQAEPQQEVLGLLEMAGLEAKDAAWVRMKRWGEAASRETSGEEALVFVEELPVEDPIARAGFKRNSEALASAARRDPGARCGLVTERIAGDFLHLFLDERERNARRRDLALAIEQRCQSLKSGVAQDRWRRGPLRAFLQQNPQSGSWERNNAAFEAAIELSGCLAARSNRIASGAPALDLARSRLAIEGCWEKFEVRETANSPVAFMSESAGRRLVLSLVLSIRMALRLAARRGLSAQEGEAPEGPDMRLEVALGRLKGVWATRMGKSSVWRLLQLTKKQREAFALLGIKPPKERLELL